MRIEKVLLSEENKKQVTEGFAQHAIESVGFDGGIIPFSFAAYDNDKIAGIIDCKFFWGQLHIRWLFVLPSYRKKGIGKALMLKALSYAKEVGCHFAFVETMSFQGIDFYKKLGFVVELSRPGYANNTSFIYLKKEL
jgi:ribosomal protein S18 acetylase RimI-like enzyme